MRIVDLSPAEDPERPLGLHPSLSVVAGLRADARQWFVESLTRLLRGDDSPLSAHVDRDGDPGILRPGDTALLPSDIEVAARSIDREARARSAGADDEELRAARAAHAAAEASLEALEATVAEAAAEHRAAADAHRDARRAIEEARRDVDPYASAALDACEAAAHRLEIEIGTSPGACRADTLDTAKNRIVLLEAERRDITAALELLASADPERVANALDVVRIVTATGPITPPEVLRLADEWASISEHLAALEAKFATAEGGVQSVSDRLDAARARLAECEAALAPTPVNMDDVRALEAAHEKVLAAERKASSRLGGSRGRRALEEALAEEKVYLDRLGYPTWSAWIMGAPLLDTTAEQTRKLEEARREVEEATAAWEQLTEKLEADPEFRSLLDRLERVLEAAHAIVGDVDDVEHALRGVRIDPGPPPCTVGEARAELSAALAEAGLVVDDEMSLDDLRVRAERWLAEIRTIAALRRQLEIDLDHCESELRAAQETFDRIEAVGPVEPGDGWGADRLAEARAELLEAEQRVHRHRHALTRVAQLVAEAEALAEVERQRAAEVEAKQELLAVTRSMVEAAAARCAALEPRGWEAPSDEEEALIAGLDAHIGAVAAAAGEHKVPVVFDDVLLRAAPEVVETVLGWLETVAADTPVIYMSDDPAVLAWATRRNPDRVGIIDASDW